MLVVIRGAGDIATGIALRLWRAHIQVVMTDLDRPTAIRRTVCFSQAIPDGETMVEDVTAKRAADSAQALELLSQGVIPVLVDPKGCCISVLKPDGVVDAVLAKKNLGTHMTDAQVVIGVGPGFTAGEDCHAVVETMRGHYLGRVFYKGSAQPNTGIPGLIGGFAGERVLRAPADGLFHQLREIGDQVKEGDIAATVDGRPMICTLTGVLRGILPEGTPVFKGMKAGDIDPRCETEHCYCASDKALAVGGSDLAKQIWIVHNGGEEVSGLDQSGVPVDHIDAGVVTLVVTHDQPGIAVGLKAFQQVNQRPRPHLCSAAGQLGQFYFCFHRLTSTVLRPIQRAVAVPLQDGNLFNSLRNRVRQISLIAHTGAAAAAQIPGHRHEPGGPAPAFAGLFKSDGPEMRIKCGDTGHLIMVRVYSPFCSAAETV